MFDAVQTHRSQPTRLPRPWDSQGKNTGVGRHFFLQCMEVKVKSVAQSCLTPSNPVDCSPPGSSVHGIFQARVLEWVAIAFSDIHTYIYIKKSLIIAKIWKQSKCTLTGEWVKKMWCVCVCRYTEWETTQP